MLLSFEKRRRDVRSVLSGPTRPVSVRSRPRSNTESKNAKRVEEFYSVTRYGIQNSPDWRFIFTLRYPLMLWRIRSWRWIGLVAIT